MQFAKLANHYTNEVCWSYFIHRKSVCLLDNNNTEKRRYRILFLNLDQTYPFKTHLFEPTVELASAKRIIHTTELRQVYTTQNSIQYTEKYEKML